MSRYVVDASVAAQWFLPEPGSERALRLLAERHDLSGPDLLLSELGNVLWKRVRRGELSGAEGREILETMKDGSVTFHPTAGLIDLAFDLAVELGITVYDSLYLALAAALRAILVTADRKLLRALAGTPFEGAAIEVGEAV